MELPRLISVSIDEHVVGIQRTYLDIENLKEVYDNEICNIFIFKNIKIVQFKDTKVIHVYFYDNLINEAIQEVKNNMDNIPESSKILEILSTINARNWLERVGKGREYEIIPYSNENYLFVLQNVI